MKFSARQLRRARAKAGMTQIALAEATGVRERTIGNYERGLSVPPVDKACAIANALGVDISFFMVSNAPGRARHFSFAFFQRFDSISPPPRAVTL